MKILHSPIEIGGQMRTITRELRKRGHFARCLDYAPSYIGHMADWVLNIAALGAKDWHEDTERMFEWLLPQFDIFHFHFGWTICPNFTDLPRIAAAGKKIIPQFHGSDVRILEIAQKNNPYARVKPFPPGEIKRKLKKLAEYSDTCIVEDYELVQYVEDYFPNIIEIPLAIDMEQYPINPEHHDNFIIVHAPTDHHVKGSREIMDGINSILREGIEFRLLQGKSNQEVKGEIRACDIVIDQICIGSHGYLALEAMALGKPCITYIADYMKEHYPPELPLISANPDTISAVLKRCIGVDKQNLPSIGRDGRAYVEKYHDVRTIVDKLEEVYEGLL